MLSLVQRSTKAAAFCLVALFALRARGATVCETITDHQKATIIAFSPPSTFTICHDGSEEPDVVTGRRVYLQLVPTPGSSMFRFRVHGQEAEPKLTGLSVLKTDVSAVAGALGTLSHSAEPISALSYAGDGTPLGTARARYVGVATEAFSDALERSREKIDDVAEGSRIVHRWCSELHASEFPGVRELRDTCKNIDPVDVVAQEVANFESLGARFTAARNAARESTITATAARGDAAKEAEAIKQLDVGRQAAEDVVTSARRLTGMSRRLVADLGELRIAIASLNALRPNVPVYLATYGDAGMAVLHLDAVPAGVDEGARNEDENNVSFRFPVVGRHYVDLEIGAGVTGGLPQLVSINSSNQIEGRDVDQFVALALVELEPLRFIWPDKPLAGLFRFPVIGIPLSRDPMQNFFAGAGIGWTGVGSITAGPYLLRELTLTGSGPCTNPSPCAINSTVKQGTPLSAVTTPQVNVGWFISASIDLVGIFHLFVPEHLPSFDAATARAN